MNGEMSKACENTDRELWREREVDYYAHSIHVTKQGGIGINVGGTVHVRTLKQWHDTAACLREVEAKYHNELRAFDKLDHKCAQIETDLRVVTVERDETLARATAAEPELVLVAKQANTLNDRANAAQAQRDGLLNAAKNAKSLIPANTDDEVYRAMHAQLDAAIALCGSERG